MVTRSILLASVCALAACQTKGNDAPPPAPKDAPVAVEEPPPIDASDEPLREPEPPDPGKLLAELGAVSAWQAVVDRGQYLARRGQHGVVYGTLGAPILVPGPTPAPPADGGVAPDAGLVPSGVVWLVDDTEGNGALAIRVQLGAHASTVKQGDRVALRGAWMLDESRRWYWKVDDVTRLPPGAPSDLKDPPSAPGLEIAEAPLPPGARPISLAKDNDLVYFTVTGSSPVLPGDGWRVADKVGAPVVALLNLPGERPSYGGQDFRTADERWQLRRGQTYWLRIGRIRRPAADKPALINARTAPVRVK